MPSDQGPTDPRREPQLDRSDRDDGDVHDDLGEVHEQRPASDYYDDDPYDDYDDGPRLLARRLVQGGVALLAVVLFLGVVWYAYTWGSRSTATGDVPVVEAPEGEEKVEPEDPGGMDVPHQDKLVLNQEGEGESGQVERLLPPPEEPRPPENNRAQTGQAQTGQAQTGQTQTGQTQNNQAQNSQAADSQPAEAGDAQAAQDTATAGNNGDGEQVAELPETTVPDQDMPDGGQGGDPAATGTEPGDDATGEAAAAADAGSDAGQAVAASETAPGTETAAPTAPTPGRKPGGEGAAGETQTAAADPAQSPNEPAAQPADAPDGRFAAQLAAFTSEQAARNAWSTYQQRFPEILSGQRLLLQNAEVNGQMYWRVRTGPFADRSAAQALCDRLKARDQSCLPVTR